MANNLGVTTGSDATIKTTDNAGVHTPHHNIEIGGITPAMGSGANGATVVRVALATDSPGVTTLGQTTKTASIPVTIASDQHLAHDVADSASTPIKVGARATTALSALTLVADADRTNLHAGIDGVIITRPHTNLEDIVVGVPQTNSDGTSTQCIAAQAAGIKTYLTSVVLCNDSATGVTVVIKDGTTAKITLPLPGNSGVIFNPPVPIPGTAATAWNFDQSGNSSITCSMIGFKSKV